MFRLTESKTLAHSVSWMLIPAFWLIHWRLTPRGTRPSGRLLSFYVILRSRVCRPPPSPDWMGNKQETTIIKTRWAIPYFRRARTAIKLKNITHLANKRVWENFFERNDCTQRGRGERVVMVVERVKFNFILPPRWDEKIWKFSLDAHNRKTNSRNIHATPLLPARWRYNYILKKNLVVFPLPSP